MEVMAERTTKEPWKILEFYSGIGGMRYSLMRAEIHANIVEAFDINDRANDVYMHNFGCRPFQGNIQSLSAAELDKYAAHAWLLSPPCQPYTRQGLHKDSADARASSFIWILELIPQMRQPPIMLFVENVVGFEISNTHKHMMDIFAKNTFVTQEYILSPLQFRIPYSRPRYFCLNFNYEAAKSTRTCFMKDLGLRYFTPREVANLHSFPLDFCFPEHITIRQQYALLGNSLSVAVVAPLLQYLFTEPT